MKTKYITLSQDKAGYLESGKGEETLVMIHGNSTGKESFLPQLHSSLADDCRMVAMDLPAHGDTTSGRPAEETCSMQGLVSFIGDFIERMGIAKPVLFGHSLGGHIAIEAAGGLSGSRGVFAIGTPPLTFDGVGISPFQDHPAAALIFQGDLNKTQTNQLSKGYWSELSDPPVWIQEAIAETEPEFRSILGETVARGEFKDEVKEISEFSFPVALALGEHDALVSREYICQVAGEMIWQEKVQIVPAAGHTPQLENPAAVNTLIAEFLDYLQGNFRESSAS